MKSAVVLLVALATVWTARAEMLDKAASATELAAPAYPTAEKRDRQSGIATVVIHVDAKGAATVERVMSTLWPFGAAARSAAATWKFAPALRRGLTPVAQTLEYIVLFDPEKGVTMQGPLFRN